MYRLSVRLLNAPATSARFLKSTTCAPPLSYLVVATSKLAVATFFIDTAILEDGFDGAVN